MNLDDFIENVKELTQYGNPNAPTDQYAKNLMVSINNNIARIARNWLWDWLYKSISIALSPDTIDYTLDADVASIIAIDSGDNDYLRHISLKEYLLWHKADTSAGETDEGDPAFYLYIGRDSSTGARKIRVDNVPENTTTLDGFAKKKVTRFTTSQLGSEASFLPFPEDGLDVLREFVLADVYRHQAKKDIVYPQIAIAKDCLKNWREELKTEPADDATSGLPTYYRGKKRSRRNGYTV